MRGNVTIMAGLAIALSSATISASSPSAVSSTFDIGDAAQIRAFVVALRDSSPAVWREAEIRLAVAGPRAIDAIAAEGLADDARLRPRLKPLLSMALLTSITPEDLNRHPSLHDLAAVDIARGYGVAESLAAFRSLDMGETTLLQDIAITDHRFPAPGLTPAQRALGAAHALGGFMVPAALRLCADSRPIARGYGAVLLRDVPPMFDRLAPLRADNAPIVVWHDDYGERTSVAAVATSPRDDSSDARRHPSDVFESVVTRMDIVNGAYDGMFDLINTVRQTSQSSKATTWDGWWNEARPAWNRWWALAGDGLRPPDRDEWFDFANELHGFRFRRHRGAKDRVDLRIEGPRGTRCRVYNDEVIVASGRVPMECVLRARKAEREVALSMRIHAVFADGRKWDGSFAALEGEAWRLTLFTPRARSD